MKKMFIEWILLILLIILVNCEFISFAESVIIYSIIIGLEYILKEVQEIRRLLENLNAPPFHINCRHSITPYFDEEGEDANDRL